MKNLTPYLMFNGNCEEAMHFYKDVFNGEISYMGRYGESPMEVPEAQKNKIMHTTFNFGEVAIMASDHMDSAGFTTPPAGSNVHLSLLFESLEDMESKFSKLSKGGTVTMALQDTFWGDRFGMLKDKFGIHWMFNFPSKTEEKA